MLVKSQCGSRMNESTRNLFLTNKNRCYNPIGENDKDWKDRDIAAVYKYKSEKWIIYVWIFQSKKKECWYLCENSK